MPIHTCVFNKYFQVIKPLKKKHVLVTLALLSSLSEKSMEKKPLTEQQKRH